MIKQSNEARIIELEKAVHNHNLLFDKLINECEILKAQLVTLSLQNVPRPKKVRTPTDGAHDA